MHKISNLHKVPKEQYEKLVNNDITKSHEDLQETTRSDKQPRKKHTEEQGSNKENVC